MESCTNTPVAQKYATLNNVYIIFSTDYIHTHMNIHVQKWEKGYSPQYCSFLHIWEVGRHWTPAQISLALLRSMLRGFSQPKITITPTWIICKGKKKKTTTKKDKVQNILSRVQYYPRPWGHHRRRPEEARSEKMDTKSSSTLTGQGLPRNFTLTKPFLHSFCLLHGASPSWLLWVLCPFGVQAQLNRHFHYS